MQNRPQRKDHIDAFGAMVLVLFSALMGLNQVLVKLVNAGMSPAFQAGARSVCAFIPVLLWAWWRNKPITVSDGSLMPGILAGVFFAFEFLMLFTALEYTTVSRASVFFYTMPLWTAVGAHFLIPGDRLDLVRLSGLFIAIGGVVLALWHQDLSIGPNAVLGDILCLAGAFLWAGIVLVARTTPLSRSCPEMALLYQLGVSAPILLLATPLFGEPIRELTPLILGMFTFQVFVVVAFGFAIWFWALSVYPASSMTSFSFLAPVFGVLFGWLILDEEITLFIIMALVLVSIGVVLVNRRAR
jgi:drug/metabolite transporter (DMT)-like permease